MNRRHCARYLLFLPLLTLLLTGCPPQPIIPEPVPEKSKAEVLSILNARAEAVGTLEADVAMKYRNAEMRWAEGLDGWVKAQYPDKLRMRGYHDFQPDFPVVDMGSDGRQWFFHLRFQDTNDLHLGTVRDLEAKFDPQVPLRPVEILTALGVGKLEDIPGRRDLYFTRHPGHYLFTEVLTNLSGRYIYRRITVKPEPVLISKIETFRPDGGIDTIADVTYGWKSDALKNIPSFARIVVVRKEPSLLELRLRNVELGGTIKSKTWRTPRPTGSTVVIQHPLPEE